MYTYIHRIATTNDVTHLFQRLFIGCVVVVVLVLRLEFWVEQISLISVVKVLDHLQQQLGTVVDGNNLLEAQAAA